MINKMKKFEIKLISILCIYCSIFYFLSIDLYNFINLYNFQIIITFL